MTSPAETARPAPDLTAGHLAWAAVTEAALLAEVAAAGHTLDAQQEQAVAALAADHRRGVYLHGAVGRGKSWLADRVLHLVTVPKARLHLHAFLAELSRVMTRERLPLPQAVLHLVGDARFLLLDEFHVHDIADAIMLRRTLVTLLDADVTLLMTSNYPPSRLLPDPTFHDAILPAITAIKAELDVVHLEGAHDYRAQSAHTAGFATGRWTVTGPGPALPDAAGSTPADALAEVSSEGAGKAARREGVDVPLTPTRSVRALAVVPETPTHATQDEALTGHRVVVHWDELCDGTLSVNDYLTLARRFHAVELVGVPAPEVIEPEAFQRLAYLLDVLVDADRRLDVSAAADRATLAAAKNLPRDAERMLSRLAMLRG